MTIDFVSLEFSSYLDVVIHFLFTAVFTAVSDKLLRIKAAKDWLYLLTDMKVIFLKEQVKINKKVYVHLFDEGFYNN